MVAGVLHEFALAAAALAGLLALHHAEGGAHLAHHIAAAAAVGAGLGAGAPGRAAALAIGAGCTPGNADGLGAAVHRLHKAQGQRHTHVRALAGAIGVAAAAGTAEPAKTAAEDVAEDIAQIHAAAKAAEPAALACAIVGVHTGKAKLVVLGLLFGVGEHFIGLVGLLELLLCLFVARIQIRVVLFGYLAVSLFDLILRGALGNAQHLVVIALICHTISPSRRVDTQFFIRVINPQRRPALLSGRAAFQSVAVIRPLCGSSGYRFYYTSLKSASTTPSSPVLPPLPAAPAPGCWPAAC